MESRTTEKFRVLLEAAPAPIQAKARAAYQLWAANPAHPSLRFKKVHDKLPIYSRASTSTGARSACCAKER